MERISIQFSQSPIQIITTVSVKGQKIIFINGDTSLELSFQCFLLITNANKLTSLILWFFLVSTEDNRLFLIKLRQNHAFI